MNPLYHLATMQSSLALQMKTFFFFLSAPFWQMKMTKRQVCHNWPFLCQDGFAALFVAETGQQLVQMDEALKFRDEVDT